MKKNPIGTYYTYTFKGRKYDLSGVVLAYNDNYTLLRTFLDFAENGYTIFKNEKVDHYFGDHEKMATKILALRNYTINKEPEMPIDTLDNILRFISDKYQLIQLDTKRGDACDVVRYLGQDRKHYLFKELTAKAKWRFTLRLPESQCRFISFDNNYLNGLKLITKF